MPWNRKIRRGRSYFDGLAKNTFLCYELPNVSGFHYRDGNKELWLRPKNFSFHSSFHQLDYRYFQSRLLRRSGQLPSASVQKLVAADTTADLTNQYVNAASSVEISGDRHIADSDKNSYVINDTHTGDNERLSLEEHIDSFSNSDKERFSRLLESFHAQKNSINNLRRKEGFSHQLLDGLSLINNRMSDSGYSSADESEDSLLSSHHKDEIAGVPVGKPLESTKPSSQSYSNDSGRHTEIQYKSGDEIKSDVDERHASASTETLSDITVPARPAEHVSGQSFPASTVYSAGSDNPKKQRNKEKKSSQSIYTFSEIHANNNNDTTQLTQDLINKELTRNIQLAKQDNNVGKNIVSKNTDGINRENQPENNGRLRSSSPLKSAKPRIKNLMSQALPRTPLKSTVEKKVETEKIDEDLQSFHRPKKVMAHRPAANIVISPNPSKTLVSSSPSYWQRRYLGQLSVRMYR